MGHRGVRGRGVVAALGVNGRGVAACSVLGGLLSRLASGTPPEDIPFPVTAVRPIPVHAFRKVAVFTLSQWYRMLDSLEARR